MKSKRVKKDGYAIIRNNKKYIYEGEFRDNDALIYVRVPPNICEIRSRAFSDCKNLETVDFEEGPLEEIGERAFANCQNLRSVTIPDDTYVYSYAFQGCTGLEEPVLNSSGTALYAYPVSRKDPQYSVPQGIRRIESTAFLDNGCLEEVILPDSVTTISFKAFCNCAIKKIIIPASVKELHAKAFFDCRQLETVILLGNTKIHYNAFAGAPKTLNLLSTVRHIQPHEKYWAIGSTFLKSEPVDLPDGSHLQDPAFLSLAKGCADGHTDAMWDLSCYFDMLYFTQEHPYYQLSGNYWRFMSYLAGNLDAAVWYCEWQQNNSNSQLPAVLAEDRSGEELNGSIFRYLGYLDFEENVLYDVHPTANSGITLVCTYPHDDGIWELSHYQITYRDEYLNELPITTLYHHPDSKPDLETSAPNLFTIMEQAVSASFKRNGAKRKGNPFFITFG